MARRPFYLFVFLKDHFSIDPQKNLSLSLALYCYRSLDLSFNSIKNISSISHLSKCSILYFVQNKISRVRKGDLDSPLADVLKSLELGGNRLRSIENIDHLYRLEELWLGKNKITKLEVSLRWRSPLLFLFLII